MTARSQRTVRAFFFAALAIAVVCPRPGHSDVEGGIFVSEKWRVSLAGPKSWTLTETDAYPHVLLWMTRKNPDGRILLTAEPVSPKLDSSAYAKQTVTTLGKLKFKVRPPQLHAPTGAFLLDFDNGSVFLRQAVLTVNGIGYSLTLSTKDARTRGQLLSAFDRALRSLKPLRGEPDPKSVSPTSDSSDGDKANDGDDRPSGQQPSPNDPAQPDGATPPTKGER